MIEPTESRRLARSECPELLRRGRVTAFSRAGLRRVRTIAKSVQIRPHASTSSASLQAGQYLLVWTFTVADDYSGRSTQATQGISEVMGNKWPILPVMLQLRLPRRSRHRRPPVTRLVEDIGKEAVYDPV